jgi:hypothetical protein
MAAEDNFMLLFIPESKAYIQNSLRIWTSIFRRKSLYLCRLLVARRGKTGPGPVLGGAAGRIGRRQINDFLPAGIWEKSSKPGNISARWRMGLDFVPVIVDYACLSLRMILEKLIGKVGEWQGFINLATL